MFYPGGESGVESKWFFRIVICIEIAAVPGLKAAVEALEGVSENDVQRTTGDLHSLNESLKEMKRVFSKVHGMF